MLMFSEESATRPIHTHSSMVLTCPNVRHHLLPLNLETVPVFLLGALLSPESLVSRVFHLTLRKAEPREVGYMVFWCHGVAFPCRHEMRHRDTVGTSGYENMRIFNRDSHVTESAPAFGS